MQKTILVWASHHTRSWFIKQRGTELLITLLSFVISLMNFNLVTDDYGAFCYFNLAAGQFSNYPHVDYYYNGVIGIEMIYKFLYTAFAQFNWIGISFLGFAFLALYLLLRGIRNVVFPDRQNTYWPLAFQLLFSLFFVENIIFMSHTRFSLLFCGIGLFNLAFTTTISRKRIILNSLVFTLGLLIRPESGLGMVLLVSVGYFIYNFNIASLIKRTFLPVLITAFMFSFFAYDWAHTEMYVKKVEPEIEYKIMDRQVIPLSEMKTSVDSVKYEAAMVGMWFDTRTMTPDFLRSLLLPGINLSAEHAGKIFFHALSFYEYYLFIPCAALAMLIVCLFTPGYQKVIFKIILFQIAAFLIIYAVDFNGRLVGGRHFLNLQLIGLLITLHYLFSPTTADDSRKLSRLIFSLAVIIICIGTSLTISNYKSNNEVVSAEVNCYELAMKEFEKTNSGRIVVSTLSNVYLLNRNFSIRTNNYVKNKYIIFDVFTYSLAPPYMNYLSDLCNCNSTDPVAFFKWLADEKALYIAESKRYDLTARYMDVVHHQKIKFATHNDLRKPACIELTEMREFEVREVTTEI